MVTRVARARIPRALLRGVAAWSLRLMVLAIGAQTTGFVRDAADVVSALTVGEDAPDADHDCGGACDCPPGCPNCHTAHGVGSLPPHLDAPLAPPFADAREVAPSPYRESPPPRGDPASVYRPPRSSAAS